VDFFANTYSLGQMCPDNEKKRDQKFWCVRQEKREALRFFCQKRKCFQWRRVKNELYWCRWLIFLLIFYLNVIFEKKQPICLLQPMLLFLNSIPPKNTDEYSLKAISSYLGFLAQNSKFQCCSSWLRRFQFAILQWFPWLKISSWERVHFYITSFHWLKWPQRKLYP